MATRKILTVSNRLPVRIDPEISKSPGGLVSALDGVADAYDLRWVGWPGAEIPEERHGPVALLPRQGLTTNPSRIA